MKYPSQYLNNAVRRIIYIFLNNNKKNKAKWRRNAIDTGAKPCVSLSAVKIIIAKKLFTIALSPLRLSLDH
jgi:hypothetical protein